MAITTALVVVISASARFPSAANCRTCTPLVRTGAPAPELSSSAAPRAVAVALLAPVLISRAFTVIVSASTVDAPILPLAAFRVVPAPKVAATISTSVSPASVIEPSEESIVTAAAVAFVVFNWPIAIFSSASTSIVPLPASITVPSTIVNAPLAAPPLSKSALSIISPEVLDTSPPGPNVMSSSARSVMSPLTLVTTSLTTRSPLAPPSANRLIVPTPSAEIPVPAAFTSS